MFCNASSEGIDEAVRECGGQAGSLKTCSSFLRSLTLFFKVEGANRTNATWREPN